MNIYIFFIYINLTSSLNIMEKSIHVLMLILVLLVLESASLASNFSSLSHADECSLLFQFKESMSINKSASGDSRAYPKVASWNLNTSDGTRSCCLWDGVECRFGHVIGLDLSSSFLYGPIDSNNSLFNLIHLRTLNLADNNFDSSQIPSGIGQLSQLVNLNLSFSFFSGEVPIQISQLRNLVSLDLSRNGLKMQSSDFQNLVQNSSETLRELSLSEVNIDSDLPASIGNLTHLNTLDLRECAFTGALPASIGNMAQLTVLSLSINKFTGSLPSSIGNLTQLRELHLRANGMIGQIPSSFTNLTQLTALDLSEDKFTGSLPSLESFSNLTYLSLYENNFDRWKLPDWFGKLNKITYLDLGDVNLYGEIPSSFFNLTQLEKLYLDGNQLKGELPISLFLSFKKLENLNLNENNISLSVIDSHTNETQPKFISLELASCNLKAFPKFLRFQHQLEYLNLDNNNIEGMIPGWMWNISKNTLSDLSLSQNLLMGFEQHSPVASCVNLRSLDLSHNMLHGSIPVRPPTTEYFWVSNNRLTGEIPPSICDLLSLQSLDLSFNNITGLIPPCLKKSIELFSVSNNRLTGEIPPSICDLMSLLWLDLSFNDITGLIPPCLKKLSNSLLVLNLRRNTFQGTIPNIFTNESKHQIIDLSENKLEGKVPRSLENCVKLQILDLGYNLIEDMFPFWLGALSELQVLILRFNKFHGTITIPSKMKFNFPKLHITDLSYNSFCGELPHQYFQEWSAMKTTEANDRIGDNSFSIQMTNKGVKMEYVKIIIFFSAVDFSSNMFRGKIPESIKTLSGIQSLNLSNNQIYGVIPKYIGNLTHLESLDLSSNKLSGKIPQELVQLNFLEVLNLSNNKLFGPIPQGRHFDTFSNDSYMGNQALCGYPLSMKCGDSEGLKPPDVSSKQDTESDFPDGIDWVVIFTGVACGLVIGIICGDHLTRRYYKWFIRRLRK
ncbi:putative leucine-rich repeat-containing, plant-type, leucine-rich repeat domain superfamily [Helianthus annuus]|nr:putative leucine-rich repeat-containing, plant-type, leucine-rich repeat domain superfamily [Helianthus annuus]KAJ0691568.1 putative leucine-rich repeat-containing, plant-type, leucine-rich repeat domain superfamily [Helianthus annuus]